MLYIFMAFTIRLHGLNQNIYKLQHSFKWNPINMHIYNLILPQRNIFILRYHTSQIATIRAQFAEQNVRIWCRNMRMDENS
jgi:hypothetical protein